MNQFEEIKKLIQDNNLQSYLCELEEYYLENYDILDEINFPEFEQIDYVCNSDELYSIIYFPYQDLYIKIIGEYDSYGKGNHFFKKDIKEVKPKKIKKTIYV